MGILLEKVETGSRLGLPRNNWGFCRNESRDPSGKHRLIAFCGRTRWYGDADLVNKVAVRAAHYARRINANCVVISKGEKSPQDWIMCNLTR